MPFKIVYLDDEQGLLEIFSENFSGKDREITTFSDPKAAIPALKANPPDILFIDYRLPGYTGDEIAKMLDPQIYKVLLTGDLDPKCSYPFQAIFEKPYTKKLDEIEAIICKLMEAKKIT